jgi:hypothetical protein
MRVLILAFILFIGLIEISFPVGAVSTPPVDEIDLSCTKD